MTFIVNRKQDVLMEYLSNFYEKNDEYIEQFLKVIAPESKISLRVIDWFVTNYSKKFNIMYEIANINGKKQIVKNHTGNKRQFIVYLNYKSQLKSYSKKQFDPFCRRERITYEYSKDKEITTTVGQLNFFKWALENCVLEYIKDHFTDIERDMIYTMRKNSPKGKKLKQRKKRQELSQAATKRINTHSCNVILTFA
jgi:hypothetical protein